MTLLIIYKKIEDISDKQFWLKDLEELEKVILLPYTIYFKPGLFNLLKYKVTIEPTI